MDQHQQVSNTAATSAPSSNNITAANSPTTIRQINPNICQIQNGLNLFQLQQFLLAMNQPQQQQQKQSQQLVIPFPLPPPGLPNSAQNGSKNFSTSQLVSANGSMKNTTLSDADEHPPISLFNWNAISPNFCATKIDQQSQQDMQSTPQQKRKRVETKLVTANKKQRASSSSAARDTTSAKTNGLKFGEIDLNNCNLTNPLSRESADQKRETNQNANHSQLYSGMNKLQQQEEPKQSYSPPIKLEEFKVPCTVDEVTAKWVHFGKNYVRVSYLENKFSYQWRDYQRNELSDKDQIKKESFDSFLAKFIAAQTLVDQELIKWLFSHCLGHEKFLTKPKSTDGSKQPKNKNKTTSTKFHDTTLFLQWPKLEHRPNSKNGAITSEFVNEVAQLLQVPSDSFGFDPSKDTLQISNSSNAGHMLLKALSYNGKNELEQQSIWSCLTNYLFSFKSKSTGTIVPFAVDWCQKQNPEECKKLLKTLVSYGRSDLEKYISNGESIPQQQQSKPLVDQTQSVSPIGPYMNLLTSTQVPTPTTNANTNSRPPLPDLQVAGPTQISNPANEINSSRSSSLQMSSAELMATTVQKGSALTASQPMTRPLNSIERIAITNSIQQYRNRSQGSKELLRNTAIKLKREDVDQVLLYMPNANMEDEFFDELIRVLQSHL